MFCGVSRDGVDGRNPGYDGQPKLLTTISLTIRHEYIKVNLLSATRCLAAPASRCLQADVEDGKMVSEPPSA